MTREFLLGTKQAVSFRDSSNDNWRLTDDRWGLTRLTRKLTIHTPIITHCSLNRAPPTAHCLLPAVPRPLPPHCHACIFKVFGLLKGKWDIFQVVIQSLLAYNLKMLPGLRSLDRGVTPHVHTLHKYHVYFADACRTTWKHCPTEECTTQVSREFCWCSSS